MLITHTWRVVVLVAAVALVAGCDRTNGSTTAATATSSAASPAPTAQSYVALGDSYTAAAGVPTQTGTPAGCLRSDVNYPSLVARQLKLTSGTFSDVSCSGATISDLTRAQSTDNGTNPAQISALSSATTLVTLGIGGNDVDFSGILERCSGMGLISNAINSATGGDLAPCRSLYTSGGSDRIARKIQSAGDELAAALTTIHDKAPHARVLVVGYPDLLPSGGSACAELLSITPGDLAFLNTEEVALNAELKQRAEAAGDTYVDTYTPSQGHDACTASATRWLEPWLPANPSLPLHPNARGEQGMAAAVLSAVGALR
ncbi:MAG TPA: SGNH/GDSL hydrolase family protein [Actinospica sp.]|jgi:lysophospholipase L1-like esterase|nr:SGNH/GDSL hydrolase family protein [Actinospica sp.]